MIVDYLTKLQSGAIKQAVNDLVERRTRDGKLNKNAYTSVIDVLSKMGVEIKRDALYKSVEQEYKKMVQVKVVLDETTTTLSTLTQEDANITNVVNYNPRTIASQSSSSKSDPTSGSATTPHTGGRPKGSTNEKKQKDKEKYDECMKSICDDYAAELESNKVFKRRSTKSFLDSLIENKKEEYKISNKIS